MLQSAYALQRGILSTLSGKYFGFTLCFIPTSFMGSGRPGFTVYNLAEDLCLGRCRSCMVQATLPNGPLIRAVTVGWGSGRVQTVIQVSDHYLLIKSYIRENVPKNASFLCQQICQRQTFYDHAS